MSIRRKWQRRILIERALEPHGTLPREGLARLEQILGDQTADPPIPPLVPVCKSTWWKGVRSGRFPPAIKVTSGVSAWRWEDIRRLLESLGPNKDWEPSRE